MALFDIHWQSKKKTHSKFTRGIEPEAESTNVIYRIELFWFSDWLIIFERWKKKRKIEYPTPFDMYVYIWIGCVNCLNLFKSSQVNLLKGKMFAFLRACVDVCCEKCQYAMRNATKYSELQSSGSPTYAFRQFEHNGGVHHHCTPARGIDVQSKIGIHHKWCVTQSSTGFSVWCDASHTCTHSSTVQSARFHKQHKCDRERVSSAEKCKSRWLCLCIVSMCKKCMYIQLKMYIVRGGVSFLSCFFKCFYIELQ